MAARISTRRLLKAAYAAVVRATRPVRRVDLATRMIDVETLVSNDPCTGVSVDRAAVSEPPRSLLLIDASPERPVLRGVDTTISLLDIRDDAFSLRNGYLVDPRLRVVYESKVVETFRSLRIGVTPLERPTHVDGTVAWLWNAPNYGHWLLLALPLIEHYRSTLGGDADYYYLGAPTYPYQLEALEMLGISRDRALTHSISADRLLVAIADRRADYDTDNLLFADRQLEATARPSGDRRLFVTRSGASHRRLVNEDECVRALEDAYGVELVSTAGMSLPDEVELFRGASLVVGPHGAGLTNFVFAGSDARVVELASTTYWDSLFAQIASVKGQQYALIRGPATRVRFGVPASQHDFEIDVPTLLRVVGAALGEPTAAG